MIRNLILSSTLIILLSSCGTKPFISHDMEERTAKHSVIAVLPYEMFYEGRLPAHWTEQDIQAIEEVESVLFQSSLYNQVLRSSRRARKRLNVSVQHYQETNNKLAEAGISIRNSWAMEVEELANILGVDAVVKTSLHKQQFLNDLESGLITVATDIIEETPLGLLTLGADLNKTADVRVSTSLLDAKSATVLWSLFRERRLDYTKQPREAVDEINFAVSRHFPYRDKNS